MKLLPLIIKQVLYCLIVCCEFKKDYVDLAANGFISYVKENTTSIYNKPKKSLLLQNQNTNLNVFHFIDEKTKITE